MVRTVWLSTYTVHSVRSLRSRHRYHWLLVCINSMEILQDVVLWFLRAIKGYQVLLIITTFCNCAGWGGPTVTNRNRFCSNEWMAIQGMRGRSWLDRCFRGVLSEANSAWLRCRLGWLVTWSRPWLNFYWSTVPFSRSLRPRCIWKKSFVFSGKSTPWLPTNINEKFLISPI